MTWSESGPDPVAVVVDSGEDSRGGGAAGAGTPGHYAHQGGDATGGLTGEGASGVTLWGEGCGREGGRDKHKAHYQGAVN